MRVIERKRPRIVMGRPEAAGVSPDRLAQVDRHLCALGAVYDLVAEVQTANRASSISAVSLFHRLQPLLRQMMGTAEVAFEIAEAPLSARQGCALSLIVTELANGAAQHGAEAIRIFLRADPGRAQLTVETPDRPATGTAPELRIAESLNRHYLGGNLRHTLRPQGRRRVQIAFALDAITEEVDGAWST